MRLLYLVNQGGTFFSHRLPWAIMASERGWDVHVAGPLQSEEEDRVRSAGFVPHTFPFVRGIGGFRKQVQSVRGCLRILRSVRPHVAHLVGTQVVATLGPLMKPGGVPAVVASVTGLGHAFLTGGARGRLLQTITTAGYRLTMAHPNATFVFQNQDDVDVVRSHPLTRHLVPKLIRGSGVDTTEFPFSDTPTTTPARVILPARLLREKGVYSFVEAARLLKKRKVAAHLVLVGDIDHGNPSSVTVDELREWQDLGLLEWAGRSEDMPTTLAGASIVVLPSFREGLPKVLLEAASVGRPLIATDVPGCREVVLHEKNGLLVPLEDPAALAAAIERLVNEPALRQRFGRRGRKLVENELSAARVSAAYLALYEHVNTT